MVEVLAERDADRPFGRLGGILARLSEVYRAGRQETELLSDPQAPISKLPHPNRACISIEPHSNLFSQVARDVA